MAGDVGDVGVSDLSFLAGGEGVVGLLMRVGSLEWLEQSGFPWTLLMSSSLS